MASIAGAKMILSSTKLRMQQSEDEKGNEREIKDSISDTMLNLAEIEKMKRTEERTS